MQARDLKGLQELAALIDALPYSVAEMEKCYGRVIGLIYIDAVRTPEDCNGYPWAKGPYCHVITHSISLQEPVPIAKPRCPGSIWSVTSEEERQRILAQIPDGPPTRHDLTPLRSPSAPHGSSGAGAV